METAEMVLGLGAAMAISFGVGFLLARLLWAGLLRAMCACMGLAQKVPALSARPAALPAGRRGPWNLGGASVRG